MEIKIYKPALLLMAALVVCRPVFAQDTLSEKPDRYKGKKVVNLNLDLKPLVLALNNIDKDLHVSLSDLDKEINISVPGVSLNLKNINVTVNDGDDNYGEVQERSKTYTKSYPFDANDKLQVTNKFGKVTVNTWNKNEVKVDVQIKGIANDDGTAQKLVDAISISDSKDGDVVSFHTNFGNNSNSGSIWDLFNNRNDHHKAEVNYTIYMPSKNALSIDNRYGAIELPNFDGKVTINSAYGSFDAKSLPHADNDIKVRYGSANIESLSSSDLDVGYGSLDLGSVDKLNSRFSYSSAKIGKVKTSASIDARYSGGVELNELDKNFTSLSFNGSYSGLKVGIGNATNADFDVTVRYGGFDYNDLPVEITQKSPPDSARGFHPTQSYKGHIGKGNADKTITIKSSYGGVKFE